MWPFIGSVLQALARIVTPLFLYLGGRSSARADAAESALDADKERTKRDAEIARLPDSELADRLRRFQR